MKTAKTFVVVGATSDLGKLVADKLEMSGHLVRPVSRKHGISLDDITALKEVFLKADGAYLMLPFDMAAPDLHQRETEIATNITTALETSNISRIVFLSAASAHLKGHTGSGMGAAIMEEKLDKLNIPELVHLRTAFFMENFIKGMGFAAQAESGTYGTAFRPDIALPMIAVKDIAEKVVEILTEEPFIQPRVRELLGARDYTMAEATSILGAALGKPQIEYVQSSYEDAHKAMLAMGVSHSFADAVMETSRSFNAGDVWAKEERSASNTTPTTLEQFAQEVFGGNK